MGPWDYDRKVLAVEKLGEGWNPAPEHKVGGHRREIKAQAL